MSTLKVTNLQHPSSASANVTLDASGNADFNGKNLAGVASVNGSQLGGARNLVTNGAMTVAQRSTSASTSSTGFHTVDRFYLEANGTTPTVTMSQDTASTPDVFSHALKLEVTSTGTPDGFNIAQKVEGYTFASAGFGKSDAKNITFSFWVRSSLTGTYSCAFLNYAANRTYVAEYTINSADTWEYKSITVDADTSGTWLTTNGIGLQIHICLDNDGGTYATSTIGSWLSVNKYAGSTNQVNWAGTNGNTFYITGVQLEVSSDGTATSFEHESYGTTLQKCQRYYQQWNAVEVMGAGLWYTADQVIGHLPFKHEMRTAPTITVSAANFCKVYKSSATIQSNDSSSPFDIISTFNARINLGMASSGTAGQGALIQTEGGAAFYVDAEL